MTDERPRAVLVLPGRGSYIGLTRNKRANIALNYYQPGQRDEMHCHPGSEHIFLCWQGALTIWGFTRPEPLPEMVRGVIADLLERITPTAGRRRRSAG